MSFKTSYDINEKLYESHLTTIKGVKFTYREIDIITCIIHNRGEKKIASLFLISPRTISAHVYNIMNKIGCNAKDQIIDFIESSGKLAVIKEYYLHLLLKAQFEKQLVKIGNLINRKKTYCYCTKEETLDTNNSLYQSIQRHLKLANFEIKELESVSTKEEECKDIPRLELKKITEDRYYHDLLFSLPTIIKSDQLDEIIKEFDEFYNSVIEIQKENIPLDIKTKKYWFVPSSWRLLAGVLLAFVLVTILLEIVIKYRNQSSLGFTVEKNMTFDKPQIIRDLEEFLALIENAEFSANNLDNKKNKDNQSVIKKVEKILDYQNLEEVKEYFKKAEMDSAFLVKYLYTLQALSTYYMYNWHDGKKAGDILLHAKDLIENYVNVRSGVDINFDQLSVEEIFTELQVVRDLPQIYVRTLYSLGRTYIYSGGLINGKKYFELTKKLGCKLGLFEGYLSDVSGLLIIEKENIELNTKNNKIEELEKILQNIIENFKKLKHDDKTYVMDYNPALITQNTIIPAKNAYNIFYCDLEIIECYKDLLSITEHKNKIASYVRDVNQVLVGDKSIANDNDQSISSNGLIQLIDKVPLKKLASLYNVLGNIFLILTKENVTDFNILNSVQKLLQERNEAGDREYSHADYNLQMAEFLFEKARSISRSTDYTKSDAYDGLLRVYREKLVLNQDNLTDKEKEELLNEINSLAEKRDSINSRNKTGSKN